MIFYYEFAIYYDQHLHANPQHVAGYSGLYRPNASGPTLRANFTSAELPQPDAMPVYGYQDNEGRIAYYYPAAIKPSGVSENSEKSAGSITLTVARDFPIAALYRTGSPSCVILLTIYQADYEGGPRLAIYSGRVRSVEFGDLTAAIQVRPITDALQRPGLTVNFSRACPYTLYDPLTCGAAITGRGLACVADSVSADGLTITSSAAASQADGHFTAGFIEYTPAGAITLAGNTPSDEPLTHALPTVKRLVLAHAGNSLSLISAAPGLTAGTTFTAFKGCKKTAEACAEFNNVTNFGGFRFIPVKNIFKDGVK